MDSIKRRPTRLVEPDINPPLAIQCTTKELFARLPQDQRVNPEGAALAYTHKHPEHFGGEVPVYEDPSHLAAWVYGYLACAADITRRLKAQQGK